MSKRNIILFGGAFDPITVGHVKIANSVIEILNPDELWISPCYKHSFGKNLTPAEDRLEMCRIAVKNNDRYHNKIDVCSLETDLKLELPTYYTLQKVFELFPSYAYSFSMIIGIDNANCFDRWVRYKDLQKLIPFIVVSRSGVERDKSVDWYMQPPHVFLEFPYSPADDISSTKVRELVYSRESISGKVPDGVWEYIRNKNLYLKKA